MSSSRTDRCLALVVVAGLTLAACGARPGPADAIASYSAALREARYADAYRLLSTETRRILAYDDFERLAREHPDEVRETVRWLERVDPQAPVTARMDLANGEAVTFVEENGEWRLDPSVLDFYGQRTPRQALRSFVRALERRRWDVLLRFVPRRLAEGLTADRLRQAWSQGNDADEVQRMLRQLQGSLDYPIEVVGNRATMSYGPGRRYVVQFLREDGEWKIEDPE
jgi:hypothetical protein